MENQREQRETPQEKPIVDLGLFVSFILLLSAGLFILGLWAFIASPGWIPAVAVVVSPVLVYKTRGHFKELAKRCS